MKRFISYLLILALCLSLLPSVGFAADGGTCGNLSWRYENGVLTISGYGAMPDFDTTYADTRAPWYLYMTLVHTVIIKNGVTSIGAWAFYNYDNITSIDLPNSVRSIGDHAFLFCGLLEDVPLPQNLTHIGDSAFAFCPLKEIILPDSLTQLSDEAFYYCSKATKLHFGSRLASIGAGAFEGCSSIKEITIPQGLNIGKAAFRASGLTKLTLPDRIEGAKDIIIEKNAFEKCSNLEEVYIGDSITTISDYAFNECTALKDLTIGERVSTIGKYAFYGNTSLTEVIFPDSLTMIDDFAFMFCTGLKKVSMGASPVTTDQHAFANCNRLEEVHISDLSAWCMSDFYEYNGNPLYFAKNLYLNGEVLEHMIVPEDVTYLGTAVFYNANNLKTAVLPQNVAEIGWSAFGLCKDLELITVLNPNCRIVATKNNTTTGTVAKTVLHGWLGSTLQTHAETYGYTFTSHSETIVDISEPTCTEPGERIHNCSACNLSYSEVVPALGHDYTSTSTEASCTEGSVTTYVCNRCGDSYEVVGQPLAHNYLSELTAPTCTTEGFTTYTCVDCGDTYVDEIVEAFGHSYEAKTTSPTCTEGGFTEYICGLCGDSYISDYTEASGHKYHVNITEPTCTENGHTEYTCSVCGDSYISDYTSPRGHDYIANITEPTCLDIGFTEYICSVCGDSYISDYTSPRGHDYIANVTEPTCLDIGFTEYICSVCGDSYVYDYIEPSGHDHLPYITEPTCTEDGFIEYICSVCGDCYIEALPAYCPSSHLADVALDAWYHAAVDYVLKSSLMNGMSATTFEPETAMNRAMLVTVLWRYAGAPIEGENTFTDVPDGQWYTNAIAWAAHNGIVGGVGNNQFAPDGSITREQLATILYRYCNSIGIDTGNEVVLSSYPDCGKISSYASKALAWAVAEGLINGIEINSKVHLVPQGNATRAQVATILMRFIENVV